MVAIKLQLIDTHLHFKEDIYGNWMYIILELFFIQFAVLRSSIYYKKIPIEFGIIHVHFNLILI